MVIFLDHSTTQRNDTVCVLLSECDALVHSPSPPHTHRQIYGRASPPTFFKPRVQQHQRTKIRWQKRPINPHISKKFATSRCGFRHQTCIFAAHSPNAVQISRSRNIHLHSLTPHLHTLYMLTLNHGLRGFHWAGSLSRLVIHDPLGHTQAPDDL